MNYASHLVMRQQNICPNVQNMTHLQAQSGAMKNSIKEHLVSRRRNIMQNHVLIRAQFSIMRGVELSLQILNA